MSNNNIPTTTPPPPTTTITIAMIAAIGLLLVTVFTIPQAVFAEPKAKVTICHVPEFEGDDPETPEEEEPEEPSTKTINFKAAAKHLENHEDDFLGPCPEE